eukprot:TRINITY_DN22706_c0_g1_i1.p1 TRINITY_DN22706_c0_g1~~TRINITY_DN22706_c0_g1_i1.p1  ORF type:complete len:243 (-),score=27.63 TRINITY_DN22706_c0_g1_i1:464-1138(-)
MGKGKGSPEYWVAPVRPGTILFEADGVSLETATEALRLAAQKLPIKTKMVVRRDYQEGLFMINSEIQGLSIEEIKEKISSSEKSLQSMKFANAISPIENPLQIKDVRRFIARLKTELHNRVVADVADKAKSGELTNFNAREFLSKTNLDSPLNLAKIKRIIADSKNQFNPQLATRNGRKKFKKRKDRCCDQQQDGCINCSVCGKEGETPNLWKVHDQDQKVHGP